MLKPSGHKRRPQPEEGSRSGDEIAARAAVALLYVTALVAGSSIAGSLALRFLEVPDWDYQAVSRWSGVLGIIAGAGASALWMGLRQGWRNAALLLGLCVLVAGGADAVGVMTGVPFGRYTYTDQLGPKAAGLVPYVIPLAWFMMAYPALHIAHWLLKRALPQAALAGALLTLWDLALDPAVTARWPAWVWQGAGGLYGVPLTNFGGWLLVGTAVSGAYLRLAGAWRPDSSGLPVALYGVQGTFAAALALLADRPLAALLWLAGACALGLGVRARRQTQPGE